MALLPSCLAGPPSLSSPQVFPSHPFARTGSEPLCPAPWADPTARLAGSLSVRLRRCPRLWLPPSAPRLWWSPPDRRAVSSAGVRGRREPLPPPPPACGALRGRLPFHLRLVRHRQGTVPDGIAHTSNRDATVAL